MGHTFYYETLIRESHIDTFGHVNNATYLELFEEARWDFVTQNGTGLQFVLDHKQGPILLDAYIKFKSEIKLREKIVIESTPEEFKNKIGKIKQLIKKSDGTIAAEAEFTVAIFDLEKRTIISPPEAWRKSLHLPIRHGS